MPSILDSHLLRQRRRQRNRLKSRSSAVRTRALEHLEQRAMLAGDVSGFVYVDSNGQGVPGALITLTGTDSSGNVYTRSQLTSNSGAFSFAAVPNGTYSLLESQPAALAQGTQSATAAGATTSTDVISNIVVNDANVAGNVFREQGLLPEYISLSLFFSSSANSPGNAFREVIAAGEAKVGNTALAAQIRAGASNVPTDPGNTNQPPVGVADTYNVVTGQTLTISQVLGVLANDTDPNNNPLTASLVTTTANGTLTLNANGSFTYTPNSGFTGTDTFVYRANDGSLSSANTTVTINVTATNQAPTAVNDTYSTNEDTTLNIAVGQGVLANDTDPENNTLTATVVTTTTNGTLTLNANGSFTYTPNANFVGTDTFTYRANDGTSDSAEATVTITINAVNDAPVAANDNYQTNIDTTLTIDVDQGVLANDTDVENTPLTATIVTNPTHGTLTLNSNGSFTYTPDAGYQGTDTFVYVASDGVNVSNAATVTIQVNNLPVAQSDAYTTTEDTPLVVDVANGVLSNDTDANGDPLTAVVVTNPAHGTLTLNADGSFTYTPNANFAGTDTFTYRANDGLGNSEPATVTITVTGVNDAPVAVDDSYSTTEDTPLTINAPGVLGNDTDADGDTLTVTIVDNPANGTVTLNENGSFVYTPNTGFTGTDTFTYKVNDGTVDSGTATVTITVTSSTAAPIAEDDAYNATEDTQLVIDAAGGVLDNDTGSTLTALVVTGPAHGTLTLNADGSFTYTPAENYNGTDTFTYKVNNGTTDSNVATVTIVIAAVNDAPTTQSDDYTTSINGVLTIGAAEGVLANDSDVENDDLTAILVAGPEHGTLTLNEDGSFTYTPTAGYQGVDTFTYKANDGTVDSAVTTVTITINGVPAGIADSYTTAEDTVLTVDVATGVLANDTDPDDDELTAILVDQAAHGTVTLNANGSFVYTPNENFYGTDTFTYKANDGLSDSPVVTVTITVTPVNDAPVANDDSYDVNEGDSLVITTGGILANDTDADGDELTAIQVTGPEHGTLTLNEDGTFTYTPNAGYTGTDTFTYKVNDGNVDSNIATVTITIAEVPPVAMDDSYTTAEDTPLVIDAATGVLDNDVDTDPLTAILVTGPSHGTLTLNEDGSFTYTPDDDYYGTDVFTYKANDGAGDSNIATVTITITPVNDAGPVANDDNYEMDEGGELVITTGGVLANDTDIDGDVLTAILVTGPSHGTLTLNDDGTFTYTPAAGYTGTDTFTYKANDGFVDSEVATVTITIAEVAPVANDDSYTTNENTTLIVDAANGVLENDVDTDSLTVTVVDLPSHGTVTLNSDGSFTYIPTAGYTGTDTFTYRANDGAGDSNLATVTITIVEVVPVAANDSYTTAEDTELVIDVAGGVLANDTDTDAITAIVVDEPAHGTLVLNSDGSFTYTPDADYYGTDTFTYKANDGTSDSNVATVTITITPVNDAAPVANDDNYETDAGEELVITTGGVLANDTDVDGDELTATLVAGPSHGTLTLNEDGTFTYTPAAGYTGTDTFTYTANDGTADSNTATVTITIHAVINAPTATDDTYTATEDETLTIAVGAGVLANDADPQNDPLTVEVVDEPAHGTLTLNEDGSFTYVPDANFNGTDTFTYRANDGTNDSNIATVTIHVTAVNDTPVAVGESYSTPVNTPLVVDTVPGLLANDTDVEDSSLTVIEVDGPEHGTLVLNEDGTFTYTPDEDYEGSDSFTYKVSDGELESNTVTVLITVGDTVNTAPVAVDDNYNMNEDGTLTVDAAGGVLANDTDADEDTLEAVLVTDVAHGSLTLYADGSFTYTPDADYVGTDSFTYKANDGTADSNVVTVTITIAAVDDLPVANNDSYTTAEDTPLTIAAPGVLLNDVVVDGETLTLTVVVEPLYGTVVLNNDGSFVYTPDENYFGQDSFTYKINDGTTDSNTVSVVIEVTSVDDAPVAGDDSFTTNEDTPLTITVAEVLANDSDVEGSALEPTIMTAPEHGTVTFEDNGDITYTPNANFHGTDSFTYTVSDGVNTSNLATITITVNSVEDAPVAVNEGYTTSVDTELVVDADRSILLNDTDGDGDTLQAILVQDTQHGTLNLLSDGTFTYMPDPGFTGTDGFSYRATDGTLNSLTTAVTIYVNAKPVANNDSYNVTAETPLVVAAAAGLLANDTDLNGHPLAALLVEEPEHGTLTLYADGSFTYTPDPGYIGTDSFTYRAEDAFDESDIATVTLTIAEDEESFGSLVDNVFGEEDSWL